MRLVLMLSLLLGIVIPSVLALLPELSIENRLRFGRHVFIGTVESVEYKDLDRAPRFPDWITRHYKCVVKVNQVVRTRAQSRPNPSHPADETLGGETVFVMAWRGVGRPDGFVGDSGTTYVPEEGKQYAFYTQFLHPDPHLRSMYHDSYPHMDDEDKKAYNALMPNGIDPDVAGLLKHLEEHDHDHSHEL